MYSKEIEQLIEMALTDGRLTEKERNILHRRAVAEGIDPDELDMVIDARLQQISAEGKSDVHVGKSKKCPYCGSVLPALTDMCPDCGQMVTPEATAELEDILDHLEDALVDLKSGNDFAKSKANVERYIRKAKVYYEHNPKVQQLLAEITSDTTYAEKNAKTNARNRFLKNNVKLLALLLVVAIAFAAYIFIKPVSAEDQVKNINSQVTELVEKGDVKGADKALRDAILSQNFRSRELKLYDPMFFTVIDAYIKSGNLDAAESLALVWKAKINNDFTWRESSCYLKLKKVFAEQGKDFSAIKSKYDSDKD